MTPTGTPQRVPLSVRGRLLAVAAAMGLLVLLALAAAVKPDPQGRGTHQQLGLPPCSFSVLFHRPCPSCGMTTSWAWLVRGVVPEALKANAGGTLLGIVAMLAVPWLLLSAWVGRWLAWTPGMMMLTWGAAVVLVVTLAQWGWRLAWP